MEKLIKQMMDDQVSLMAELGGYTETLNLLQAKFCQFDGSEDKDERNNTVDALYTLYCSMERFGKECSARVNGYWERFAQCRAENSDAAGDPVKASATCGNCENKEKYVCSPLKQWQCKTRMIMEIINDMKWPL